MNASSELQRSKHNRVSPKQPNSLISLARSQVTVHFSSLLRSQAATFCLSPNSTFDYEHLQLWPIQTGHCFSKQLLDVKKRPADDSACGIEHFTGHASVPWNRLSPSLNLNSRAQFIPELFGCYLPGFGHLKIQVHAFFFFKFKSTLWFTPLAR